MSTDDDILSAPVPEPDDEPTAAERAHAKTFADLVEKTLAGRTPPAMSADDRALLEVATVIRATSGGLELAPSRQRSLVEDALRQAVGVATPSSSLSTTPISSSRKRRMAPWIVSGVSMMAAAAAMVALYVRTPKHQPAKGPVSWYSRPTDALVGEIKVNTAPATSARLDLIYADRLDGFRDRALLRGGKR